MREDTWHPRPGPIPAAMYTLRDVLVDVLVIHGPRGCCFRTARLLEKDGVRVLVTGMTEEDFIFGATDRLVEALRYVEENLNPDLVGVVSTCVTSIIGEDMETAVETSGIDTTVITVEVHNGMGPNIEGVVKALEAAAEAEVIPEEEVDRQRRLMKAAAELERKRGMASKRYLEPWEGHDPYEVAEELVDHDTILAVLNAKKETAYLFADPVLELGKAGHPVAANLSPRSGLPKVRKDAETIRREFERTGVKPEITGALDEYAVTERKIMNVIEKIEPDAILVSGIPHALNPDRVDAFTVAVTDGLREASALRELGYDRVVVEEEAHARVLGKRHLIPSRLGDALRTTLGG